MRSGSDALLPAATLDEDAWEDLLSYIEERQRGSSSKPAS